MVCPLPVPPPLPRAQVTPDASPESPAPSPSADAQAVPVYFLSDSTGITVETMGSALLSQFHGIRFERHMMPFLRTAEDARVARDRLDAAMNAPVTPIVFLTVVDPTVREILLGTRAPVIDFVGSHMAQLERQLGISGDHAPRRMHSVRDQNRYNRRMAAVEFAIEHDDGQSIRALERADVIIVAPSRCGKTPTSMYLALLHGVFVANYPLVDEDFDAAMLPMSIRHLADRCFGLLTSPQRLADVREERRPRSRYASLDQTRWELSRARRLYDTHSIPFVDSSTKSVEEMSTLILQAMKISPTTA